MTARDSLFAAWFGSENCRYWLARALPKRDGVVENRRVELVDGCHGDPEGVVKAARLHERIFDQEGPWLMVTIADVPDLAVEINEDAAETCAALMRGEP